VPEQPTICEVWCWKIVTAQPDGMGGTRSVDIEIDYPVKMAGVVHHALQDGPGYIPAAMRTWQLPHLPDPRKDWGSDARREFLCGLGLTVHKLLKEAGVDVGRLHFTVKGALREINFQG